MQEAHHIHTLSNIFNGMAKAVNNVGILTYIDKQRLKLALCQQLPQAYGCFSNTLSMDKAQFHHTAFCHMRSSC